MRLIRNMRNPTSHFLKTLLGASSILSLLLAFATQSAFAYLDITSPTAGQAFQQNGPITVTWDTDQPGTVTVFFVADATPDANYRDIGTFPASAGSATFYIRNAGNEGYSYDIYDATNTTRIVGTLTARKQCTVQSLCCRLKCFHCR